MNSSAIGKDIYGNIKYYNKIGKALYLNHENLLYVYIYDTSIVTIILNNNPQLCSVKLIPNNNLTYIELLDTNLKKLNLSESTNLNFIWCDLKIENGLQLCKSSNTTVYFDL